MLFHQIKTLPAVPAVPADGDVIAGSAGCFVPCQAQPGQVGIFRSEVKCAGSINHRPACSPAVQLGLITGGILNIL